MARSFMPWVHKGAACETVTGSSPTGRITSAADLVILDELARASG
jgi:hypothetical protein